MRRHDTFKKQASDPGGYSNRNNGNNQLDQGQNIERTKNSTNNNIVVLNNLYILD